MKSLAAIQSSYIPWKGYFDLLNSVEEFVLYDDVQFTKNDWRNRNVIKTHNGTTWLTIPVRTTGRFGQTIQEVRISDPRWATKHWKSIAGAYARAPHFGRLAPWLEELYERAGREESLSRVNELFLRAIVELLGFDTHITRASDYDLPEDRNQRLVVLCRAAGASTYLSGPAARSYLDESLFRKDGIEVQWMSYEGYPEYNQLHGEFVHGVSILDLLLNHGPTDACRYLLSTAEAGSS